MKSDPVRDEQLMQDDPQSAAQPAVLRDYKNAPVKFKKLSRLLEDIWNSPYIPDTDAGHQHAAIVLDHFAEYTDGPARMDEFLRSSTRYGASTREKLIQAAIAAAPVRYKAGPLGDLFGLTSATRERRGFTTLGYSDAVTRQLRLRSFELRSGIDASNTYASQPPIFSDAERELWEEMDREHRRGVARSAFRGVPSIPMPTTDPRKPSWYGGGGMPPAQSLEGANVQATLNGSAEVHGEVQGTWIVQAGSELISIVENVKKIAVQVQGKLDALGSNGPGSTGKSSPDAAAPSPKGNTGGATGDW
jgi:hypothetical protein